jgi:hypothetical protein
MGASPGPLMPAQRVMPSSRCGLPCRAPAGAVDWSGATEWPQIQLGPNAVSSGSVSGRSDLLGDEPVEPSLHRIALFAVPDSDRSLISSSEQPRCFAGDERQTTSKSSSYTRYPAGSLRRYDETKFVTAQTDA